MVFDKDGKVIYAENEKSPGEVTVRLLSMTCKAIRSSKRRSRAPMQYCRSYERLTLLITKVNGICSAVPYGVRLIDNQ